MKFWLIFTIFVVIASLVITSNAVSVKSASNFCLYIPIGEYKKDIKLLLLEVSKHTCFEKLLFDIVFCIASRFRKLEIPEHLKKHARKLHKRCQNQTDTPDDIIRSSLKGDLPKNKNFECYIQCIFDIIGIMDESSTIRIDLLTQVLPEELHPTLTMLADNCGTKEGSDKCNIAYNTLQCYVDNNPMMIKQDLEFLFE